MKFQISNFRSIKEQEVEIAPITLLYGPNGAGKSSLIYALLTAKNIVLNPNQNVNGIFNYNFVNLGSFEAVIFDHQKDRSIELGLSSEDDGYISQYHISIGDKQAHFGLAISGNADINLELPFSFPYPLNQQVSIVEDPFNISWNGITAMVQADSQDQKVTDKGNRLAAVINSSAEKFRKLGVAPLGRGFTKPHYSATSVTPWLITEDEVATALSNNKYMVSRVSFYLESIFERDFRVNVQPGTAIFSLDTTDKKTGISAELVNEGFGVNQTVYILAKSLNPDVDMICIEEPEIHLHPTAIRKLAKTLTQIMRDEGKEYVISTHSEALVSGFLALVAKGYLKPSDLACYLVQKEKRVSKFNKQDINDKGQIDGGLHSFIEGELEDIKTFLKISKK